MGIPIISEIQPPAEAAREQQAREFLAALHAGLTGHVVWFRKPGGEVAAAPLELPRAVERSLETSDTWVSVCSFPTAKRDKTAAHELPGFWFDADAPKIWAPADAEPDREKLDYWRAKKLEDLQRSSPRPSLIVDSGTGYQGYFLLHRPYRLETAEERANAEDLLRRIAAKLETDPVVAELARIMRVPGSRNHKPGRGPCRIISADGPHYDLDELRQAFGAVPLTTAAQRPLAAPAGPAVEISDSDARTRLAQAGIPLAEIPAGGRNDRLFRIGCRLRALDCSAEEIRDLLLLVNHHLCRPPLTTGEVMTCAASAASKPAGLSPEYQAKVGPRRVPSPAAEKSSGGVEGGGESGGASAVTPEWPTRRDDLTDLGNAERYVQLHGKDLRHCHPPGAKRTGAWYVWSKKHWQLDDVASVHRLATDVPRLLYREVEEASRGAANDAGSEDNPKATRAIRILKWAKESQSQARLEALVKRASSMPPVPVRARDLDADIYLLNCLNGTLDLRTGQLRPHQREDLLTHLVPLDYDEDEQAPLFEWFIRDIMAGRESLVTFLRRWFGYCLTGDVREDALVCANGGGRNGKTTLLEVLRHTFGRDLAAIAPPGLLLVQKGERHPTELMRLKGKRLVIAEEVPKAATFNEERLKQLTGRSEISARGMREDFEDFPPVHKIVIAANHLPRVRDSSDAFWRRFRLVPFDVSYKGHEDKTLEKRLKAEARGILAWLVRGCREWQAEGLGEPVEIRKATAEYQSGEDAVGRYLETLEQDGEPGPKMAKSLLDGYFLWAEQEGERGERAELTATALGLELKRRGWTRDRERVAGGATFWTPPKREPPR